jgi:carbon-monoxide dehydrogenase small subunit
MSAERIKITVRINGTPYTREVEPRLLLSDFIRQEAGLTGTHVGCEHGVCGACTVLLDGQPVRSCLMFAVQAQEYEITTVEGLAPSEERLHPVQEAFWEAHGLQCGFCTPGFLMTTVAFLQENPDPNEDQIRHALSGNLCRCTGYQSIVEAVKLAVQKLKLAPAAGGKRQETTLTRERKGNHGRKTDGRKGQAHRGSKPSQGEGHLC